MTLIAFHPAQQTSFQIVLDLVVFSQTLQYKDNVLLVLFITMDYVLAHVLLALILILDHASTA